MRCDEPQYLLLLALQSIGPNTVAWWNGILWHVNIVAGVGMEGILWLEMGDCEPEIVAGTGMKYILWHENLKAVIGM